MVWGRLNELKNTQKGGWRRNKKLRNKQGIIETAKRKHPSQN